ncbi:MAG: SDR family oxidoreductase [Spongiibacteraceae bacterium]
MKLNGKICVLTGACGGIGEAIAHALDNAGASLILTGRDKSRLDHLIQQLGHQHHRYVIADLCTKDGIDAVVDACSTGIDLLINNAGINYFGLLETQHEHELRLMLEINMMTPILLTQALLPLFRAKSSTIVNIGSGFGSIGFAGYCGYSASKFALRGFTEALRRELADTSIDVLYLAPRATKTPMNSDVVVNLNKELGNTMDAPERVAKELITLLNKSQRSRFIGWPERFFIKLNSLFPSIVDKALAKQLPIIRRLALATVIDDR